MKYWVLAIGVLSYGMVATGAEDVVNLYRHGDMEEVTEGPSPEAPKGWFPVGSQLQLEIDTTEFQSGKRSLKVSTPENAASFTSTYIVVRPNTAYEVQSSVLARGTAVMARPFVGLRISGNDGFEYPTRGEQLISWSPTDEDLGFVTKKARFVTADNTYKVRIVLMVRSKPRGIVNVDDIILRETDQTE